MRSALPRRNFNSSGLVRLLAGLGIPDAVESKQSFAESLGEWLDVTDAITLFSALNGRASGAGPAASPGASAAVQEEFARVRSALVDSIATDRDVEAGRGRMRLPTPASGAGNAGAADFSPYRRYYLARQRDLDARVSVLRAHVRSALSSHSAALRPLAELDAALDRALSERERSLLATVPGLLERRFEDLRRADQDADGGPGSADDTANRTRPGEWLTVFCKDLRAVLLAELDLRLQPVVGLIEAFGREAGKHQ